MENDVLYNRIMNVVHSEYGEGSTAVANPEGEATDSLEKIQIGDDIYSISGGDGGVLLIDPPVITETALDLGASYNDLKNAFVAGKNIVVHYTVEVNEMDVDNYTPMIVNYFAEVPAEGLYMMKVQFDYNGTMMPIEIEPQDPDADIVLGS